MLSLDDEIPWFWLKLGLFGTTATCVFKSFCRVSNRICAYKLGGGNRASFGNLFSNDLDSESILYYLIHVGIIRLSSQIYPSGLLCGALHLCPHGSILIGHVVSQLASYRLQSCLGFPLQLWWVLVGVVSFAIVSRVSIVTFIVTILLQGFCLGVSNYYHSKCRIEYSRQRMYMMLMCIISNDCTAHKLGNYLFTLKWLGLPIG